MLWFKPKMISKCFMWKHCNKIQTLFNLLLSPHLFQIRIKWILKNILCINCILAWAPNVWAHLIHQYHVRNAVKRVFHNSQTGKQITCIWILMSRLQPVFWTGNGSRFLFGGIRSDKRTPPNARKTAVISNFIVLSIPIQ